MSKIYLENDHKIKGLPDIDKGKVLHPISKGSSFFRRRLDLYKKFNYRRYG